MTIYLLTSASAGTRLAHMSELPIDVDATIKRIEEHSAAIEAIKQRMLRGELDPAQAWQAIHRLHAPVAVRVNPADVHPGKFYIVPRQS